MATGHYYLLERINALENLHRFFLPPELIEDNKIHLPKDITFQISKVLRLNKGDQILILDGLGKKYLTEITDTQSKNFIVTIKSEIKTDFETQTKINLFQAMIRSTKMEFVFQKCTELGISTFTPIICERSNFHQFNLNKLNRWKKIIREASEQSRRNITPKLFEPTSFSSAISKCSGLGMIAWENEENNRIKDVLKKWSAEKHLKNLSINIFIGPEGGFSNEEINQSNQKEFESVSLGKHILRSETAGIVLSTSIFYEMDDL